MSEATVVDKRWTYCPECGSTEIRHAEGRHKLRGKRLANLWHFPRDKASDHPTPKPVALMERIVDCSSDVQGIVLDPFMGSGTTGVACMNLGRKFIGIEIEPRYFDIACERVAYVQNQGRLFA